MTLPTAIKCSSCGRPTANTYGVCNSCRAERTARDRRAQGLSEKVTDDPGTAAWLARLLLPRERKAS